MRAAAFLAGIAAASAIPASLLKLFETQANASILQLAGNTSVYPSSSCPGCYDWSLVGPSDWTCGFWPGILWRLSNTSTTSSWWASNANAWTSAIAVNQDNTGTHDVGFMTWGSFGQQYLLTGNTTAADILVATSHALAKRFVPAVHAFESWGALHPTNGQSEGVGVRHRELPSR